MIILKAVKAYPTLVYSLRVHRQLRIYLEYFLKFYKPFAKLFNHEQFWLPLSTLYTVLQIKKRKRKRKRIYTLYCMTLIVSTITCAECQVLVLQFFLELENAPFIIWIKICEPLSIYNEEMLNCSNQNTSKCIATKSSFIPQASAWRTEAKSRHMIHYFYDHFLLNPTSLFFFLYFFWMNHYITICSWFTYSKSFHSGQVATCNINSVWCSIYKHITELYMNHVIHQLVVKKNINRSSSSSHEWIYSTPHKCSC